MAKLPGVLDLGGIPQADPTRPVGTYDVTPYARGAQALAAGSVAIGQGVERIGAGVNAVASAKELMLQRQAEDAKTALATDLLGLREKYQNDTDYPTVKGRWDKEANDLRDHYIATIPPGPIRAHAVAASGEMLAAESLHSAVKAHTGFADAAHADLQATLDTANRTSVYDPSETVDPTHNQVIAGINSKIEDGVAKNYWTREQAESMREHARKSYADKNIDLWIEHDPESYLRARGLLSPLAKAGKAGAGETGEPQKHPLFDNADPSDLLRHDQRARAIFNQREAEQNVAAGRQGAQRAISIAQAGGAAPSNVLPASTATFFRQRSGGARVEGLHPAFADALKAAATEFEETHPGRLAQFESLKRTTAEQAVLFARYQSGQGGLAAPPGQSRHERGLAADIPDGTFQNWMHANASRFGLEFLSGRAGVNDPGHVQMAGQAGRGGDPGGVQALPVSNTVALAAGPHAVATAAPSLSDQYASAMRYALDDPDMNEQQRQAAVHTIEQHFRAQEIADMQTAKARKAASDEAAGGYVVKLNDMLHTPNSDFVALSGEINHDQNLTWEAKEHLIDRVRRVSGEEQSLAFGPGYMAAREGLFSAPDAPNHIADMSELVQRPDITTAGLQDLSARLRMAKADVDRHAIEQRTTALLAYAKQEIVRTIDMPGFHQDSPEGTKIYNGQFVPIVAKTVSDLADDAQKTGDRRKLDEFLSRDNFDKLIETYYPRRDRERDNLKAGPNANAPADKPDTPIPPATEGSDPRGWKDVMDVPPKQRNGTPMPRVIWGEAVRQLFANPTPETMKDFDAVFLPLNGVPASEIVSKLIGGSRTEKRREVPNPIAGGPL